MQKRIIYIVTLIVLIALLIVLTKTCKSPQLDEIKIVTIDTTYIVTIDTVVTPKYIIVTISRDSIFKRTRNPIAGKLKPNKNKIDQESFSDDSNTSKNSSKSPNTEIEEIDTFIETTTTTTIDTFLNLWPPNYDKPEFEWKEPYNPKSVAMFNMADNFMVTSQYYKYSLDEIAKLDPFTVPIKFHEIFRTDGSGKALFRDHLDILIDIDLNNSFRKANINFIRCGDINYINDSKLYNFPTIDYAGDAYNFKYLESIMAQYNMPNVLNIYLVESMGGNANGLYPGQESEKHPESMLVIRKDQIMHSIPEHEIGHWLLLRHTHYADTPNNLTTELVNGSNCETAGDMICDTKADQINEAVKESLDEKSIVFTDQSTSYVDIADYVELHITEKSDKKTTNETLKWVHITISNAKRNMLGNYHKIKGKYLQLYLNEFIYKLNRRYFGDKLFDRLVIAGITGL